MKKINKLLMLCVTLFMLLASVITIAAEESVVQPPSPSGKIVYNTGDLNVTNQTFKVYRIMDATVAEVDGENLVGYSVNDAFKAFFTDDLLKKVAGESLDMKAYNYLKDNVSTDDFKNALITYTNSKEGVGTINGSDAKIYEISNLPYGYYAIVPSNTNDFAISCFTLKNEAQTVFLKANKPTINKTTEEGKTNDSAQVGDTISFIVKSKVPNMVGFNKYVFNLEDTLSKGLTLDMESVEVTIGIDKKLTKDTDFTVEEVTIDPNPDEKSSFKISIIDMLKFKNDTNKDITFKYNAKLNDKAVVENASTNSATLEYSNNPSDSNSTDKTGTSVVKVYTHQLTIQKRDNTPDNPKPLKDAEFEIYKAVKNVDGSNYDKVEQVKFIKEAEGVYHVAKAGEVNALTNVVSPTSGDIVIKGLDATTYLIEEIKAPNGYNKLKDSETVTITFDEGDPKITKFSITIVNNKGIVLPETGGMGTIAFTVIGVVGILAVAYSFRPKKNK